MTLIDRGYQCDGPPMVSRSEIEGYFEVASRASHLFLESWPFLCRLETVALDQESDNGVVRTEHLFQEMIG